MDRFFNDNKNVLWTTIKKRREESSREKKRMIGACHECVMWWGRVTLGNPSHTAPHRLTEQNENKSRLMVRRCQKVVVSFRFGYFMSFCLFRSYHLSLSRVLRSLSTVQWESTFLEFWFFFFYIEMELRMCWDLWLCWNWTLSSCPRALYSLSLYLKQLISPISTIISTFDDSWYTHSPHAWIFSVRQSLLFCWASKTDRNFAQTEKSQWHMMRSKQES